MYLADIHCSVYSMVQYQSLSTMVYDTYITIYSQWRLYEEMGSSTVVKY